MDQLYNFNPQNLLDWVTAFCIFEIPVALFYYFIYPKDKYIRNWYSGKNINIWNVVIQDLLYPLCGIILALNLFNYLVSINLIQKNFIIFIICLVIVQLIGDSTFALIIKQWPKNYSNYWIDYFKRYINRAKFNALIGDAIYVIVWAITFYLVNQYINRFDIKIFIISLFVFLVSAYSIQKSE